MVRILLAALSLLLAGCATTPPAPERAPLILISIDGFRPDYLDRGVTRDSPANEKPRRRTSGAFVPCELWGFRRK